MKGSTYMTLLLIFLVNLLHIPSIVGSRIRRPQCDIDCRQYINDEHIIDSFPFIVHPNPAMHSNTISSYKIDGNDGHVHHLTIVNAVIPSAMYCLKHLTKLELVNVSFPDVENRLSPQMACLASSLTDLSIRHTKIFSLSREITFFKYLTKLELSNTGLRYVTHLIGSLFRLKSLILSGNNLSSIPDILVHLPSLEELTLTHNHYLRSIQTLNGHPSLRFLDTRHCPIQLIPRDLPKLTILKMTDNNLTSLNGIDTLGNEVSDQKYFEFDQNHIETVSPGIGYVRNLYHVNLARNNLISLPNDMLKATTLRCLFIKNNSFGHQQLQTTVSKFREAIPLLYISYD